MKSQKQKLVQTYQIILSIEETTLVDAMEQGVLKKNIGIGKQQTNRKYEKQRREIILNLREKGIPDDEIVKIMHISIEEANRLLAINSTADIKEAIKLYTKYYKVQAIIEAEYINTLDKSDKYILMDAYFQGLEQASKETTLTHDEYWRRIIIDLLCKGFDRYDITWIIHMPLSEIDKLLATSSTLETE